MVGTKKICFLCGKDAFLRSKDMHDALYRPPWHNIFYSKISNKGVISNTVVLPIQSFLFFISSATNYFLLDSRSFSSMSIQNSISIVMRLFTETTRQRQGIELEVASVNERDWFFDSSHVCCHRLGDPQGRRR